MALPLIEEYQRLTADCANTDFGDKASVRRHNKSVERMYQIVEAIGTGQTDETPDDFSTLLDIADNKTNLWAAAQLLEKLTIDTQTEDKALDIVRTAAKGDGTEALGFQYWLKEWDEKKK